MIDKIKAEIIELNSSIYELQERRKQLQLYLQGYEEAKKESAAIEEQLNQKIEELKGNKE